MREVVAEIAAGSEQQSQGIAQINVAVEQMNGVTQQTAANSEESASGRGGAELAGGDDAAAGGRLRALADAGGTPCGPAAKPQPRVQAKPARPAVKTPLKAAAKAQPAARKKANGNGHVNRISPEALIPFDEEELEALGEF